MARAIFRPATLVAVALVGLGLLPVSAASPLPPERDRWLTLESAHFTFHSNAPAKRTRRIAQNLEQLRATLGRLSGLELNSPTPTAIYVFKDDKSFQPYKFLYDGRPADIAGFFSAREHGNYIAINAENVDEATSIVYHEYVHHVVSNNFRNLPVWFNEGLAEYYSTFEVDGQTVSIGKPIGEHWAWLRQHAPLPLDELFAVDRQSPTYNEGTRRGSFYAQSWALVHYLLVGNADRQPQATRFLQLLGQGLDQDTAFTQAFDTDYATLENELRRYLRRLDFPYLRFSIDTSFDQTLRERPATRPEVLVLLGDLLANQGDPRPEARRHFEAALALDPQNARAIAGVAHLLERRRDLEGARKYYAQAVSLAPEDPLILYRYATLLLSIGGDASDLSRQLLRRSIRARPGFSPAWAQLSYANTFLEALPDDALSIAQTAHRLLPARWDVALNLLNHYSRLGQRELAFTMVERYFTRLDNGAHMDKARGLIFDMELRHIYDRMDAGDLDTAAALLDQLEGAYPTLAKGSKHGQLLDLRRAIAGNRAIARYNRAVDLLNAGNTESARKLLEELVLEDPDGTAAEGARNLLTRIAGLPDHAKTRTVPAGPDTRTVESLNRLLMDNRLEEALELLEAMQTSDATQRPWLDDTIAEIRSALEHNRFAEGYNEIVRLFNRQDFTAALRMARELLPTAPDEARAEQVRDVIRQCEERL